MKKPLILPPSAQTDGVPGAGVDRIDLLQTFVRIVEAGSLSAAAQQLHSTQPTISRRLQALERHLGLRLVQRSTQRMRLTEDGERCYARARELLADWQSFTADMRGADEEPTGALRIVAPHAFGQDRLVQPLAEYLRRYPHTQVEWLLHDDSAIQDFIAAGVDCAIQVGEVQNSDLVAIRLAQVPRIVVAAPALLEQSGTPGEASDLAALPWLALRTYYRREVELRHRDTAAVCRFPITPRLSTDSLYALRSAALQGLGLAIASAWILAEDLAAGRLVQLLPHWQAAPLPVYLVYPHARFYPARLRRFVEIVREQAPQVLGELG